MADFTEYTERNWLFEYLSKKGPALWHALAKDWNWDNGTWLLEWVVSQNGCQAATAQYIFWTSGPTYFLPNCGYDDWKKKVEDYRSLFVLDSLIMQNWRRGFYQTRFSEYQPKSSNFLGRMKNLLGERVDYLAGTEEYIFNPEKTSWLDSRSPQLCLKEYRDAEARCDPALLPWHVPSELGDTIAVRVPQWGTFDSHEGFPIEYLTRLQALADANEDD